MFLWRAALALQSLDSPMLGDSQETLIEQTLPVKNYTLQGASRDIYSQVCLNGRNSWTTAFILQTAPKNNQGNDTGGAGKVPLSLFMWHLSLPGTDDSLFTSTPGALQKEQDMSMSWHECKKNGIKVTLYKSESVTVKTEQNPESLLFFHLLSLLPKEGFWSHFHFS